MRPHVLPLTLDHHRSGKVAVHLGLSHEAYTALAPAVHEQIGDDGLLHSYLVTFGRPIPADAAARMPMLREGKVTLPPGFFESDAPSWPQG